MQRAMEGEGSGHRRPVGGLHSFTAMGSLLCPSICWGNKVHLFPQQTFPAEVWRSRGSSESQMKRHAAPTCLCVGLEQSLLWSNNAVIFAVIWLGVTGVKFPTALSSDFWEHYTWGAGGEIQYTSANTTRSWFCCCFLSSLNKS